VPAGQPFPIEAPAVGMMLVEAPAGLVVGTSADTFRAETS
jgi:hypothetical protein